MIEKNTIVSTKICYTILCFQVISKRWICQSFDINRYLRYLKVNEKVTRHTAGSIYYERHIGFLHHHVEHKNVKPTYSLC